MSGLAEPMSIAELASRAGVTVRTVRYYVAEGLLPPPSGIGPRSTYGAEHLLRLEAVRHLKARYYPLAEIRRLLAERSTEEVGALLADLTDGSRPTDAVGAPLSPQATEGRVMARLGGSSPRPAMQVGRAEALRGETAEYPSESAWRRVRLAPDVELHFRPSSDLTRAAAIRRLVAVAMRLLAGGPEARDHADERWT